MLKNGVIAIWLLMVGCAFWIPSEVYAVTIYTDPKTGKRCDCVAGGYTNCSFCTGSVIASGEGNTQGAKTSVFVALKPLLNPNPGGPSGKLVCENHGSNTNVTSNAFLINAPGVTGAVTNESVDRNGRFVFTTGRILPEGIHPEPTWTAADCFNNPACKAWQDYCPNGVLNGNENQSKNWVPRDWVPYYMHAQQFIYYCDSQTGKVCACDPRLDAGTPPITGVGPIDPDLGPSNRCATSTSTTKTSTNTWTFAWTDRNGPTGSFSTPAPDNVVDHFDILPADRTDVWFCSLSPENQQNYTYGASLPYDCFVTNKPDLFPFLQ